MIKLSKSLILRFLQIHNRSDHDFQLYPTRCKHSYNSLSSRSITKWIFQFQSSPMFKLCIPFPLTLTSSSPLSSQSCFYKLFEIPYCSFLLTRSFNPSFSKSIFPGSEINDKISSGVFFVTSFNSPLGYHL